VLLEIAKLKDYYDKMNFGGNKNVLVQFVSANPIGPRHIGNGRLGGFGNVFQKFLSSLDLKFIRSFMLMI
jgi:arginyl-tRNA synthetase